MASVKLKDLMDKMREARDMTEDQFELADSIAKGADLNKEQPEDDDLDAVESFFEDLGHFAREQGEDELAANCVSANAAISEYNDEEDDDDGLAGVAGEDADDLEDDSEDNED